MMTWNWMGSMHPLVRLADTLLDWIDRDRERHQLAALDDRAAEDVCVDRATVTAETDKPFWRA